MSTLVPLPTQFAWMGLLSQLLSLVVPSPAIYPPLSYVCRLLFELCSTTSIYICSWAEGPLAKRSDPPFWKTFFLGVFFHYQHPPLVVFLPPRGVSLCVFIRFLSIFLLPAVSTVFSISFPLPPLPPTLLATDILAFSFWFLVCFLACRYIYILVTPRPLSLSLCPTPHTRGYPIWRRGDYVVCLMYSIWILYIPSLGTRCNSRFNFWRIVPTCTSKVHVFLFIRVRRVFHMTFASVISGSRFYF
jgi:hypothetical protein